MKSQELLAAPSNAEPQCPTILFFLPEHLRRPPQTIEIDNLNVWGFGNNLEFALKRPFSEFCTHNFATNLKTRNFYRAAYFHRYVNFQQNLLIFPRCITSREMHYFYTVAYFSKTCIVLIFSQNKIPVCSEALVSGFRSKVLGKICSAHCAP